MSLPSQAALDSYWLDFEVADDDLEFITNLLLEREVPLTPEEMALALIQDHQERLDRQAAAADEAKRPNYLPGEAYEVGQELVFKQMGNRVGKVIGVRPGENPELGPFDVIQVQFEGNGDQREFAARLEDHDLNAPPEPTPEEEQIHSPEAIFQRHSESILQRIGERLDETEEIVYIAGRWFPGALLADINEGHLNLAEAVLDVAEGGPLSTADLMEHVELPEGLDPLLAKFSLDYALQEDDRFDEVGPAGEVAWYLKRLEPPEVLFTPPRLELKDDSYDRFGLTDELLAVERELDDEHSPAERPEAATREVTIPLLFPHWRVGTLPLSRRLLPLFPTAYDTPRIRFILVDGHSGERFPGWVVRRDRYVFGLDDWYRRYSIPAGGLVRVRLGETEGEVIVEALDRRQRNEWIRTVSIDDTGRIGFTMLKQPIGAAYDELMVVGLVDAASLDEAWLSGEQRSMPVDRLVSHVFRELAKLNPQAAVHAKSLYSGVNVIRRLTPAAIFAELVARPFYVHVGDSYWRLDESMWNEA